MNYNLEPGDVVIDGWNCSKYRPWVILWIDDDAQTVCVAPISNQRGYPGAISTGDPISKIVGSWAMIQPLHMAQRAKRVGHMEKKHRHAVVRALQNNLDLIVD